MKILNSVIKTPILTFLLLLTIQSGFSQKNLVTFTPLKPIFDKCEILYERVLTDRFSATAKVQFWFIDKKKEGDYSWGSYSAPTKMTSDGRRYNLGLRYAVIKKTKKASKTRLPRKTKLFLEAEVFTGRHHIERTQMAYSYTKKGSSNGGGLWERPDETFSDGYKYGEIDIRSSGVAIGFSVQNVICKHIVIDFGLLAGRAYIKEDLSHLILIASQPGDGDVEKDFNNYLKGDFLEPHLSVGFAF